MHKKENRNNKDILNASFSIREAIDINTVFRIIITDVNTILTVSY